MKRWRSSKRLPHQGTNDSTTFFRVTFCWVLSNPSIGSHTTTWILKHWEAGGVRDSTLGITQPREVLAWEQGWLRPTALPAGMVVPIIGARRSPDNTEAWLALALGVTGACAPMQPMALISTTTPGDHTMPTEPADKSFCQFLLQFEAATTRFINGDATLWKQHASHRDDATIMGAWGAYEQGWNEAGPRYDWAAARFRESGARVEVEYLASGVSGDLAYTVTNERSEALLVGQNKAAQMALRVTHVFRKEDEEWKLIHRHADPLMEKTAADTVLQN